MIKIKNMFDPVEPSDGPRLWVGHVNVTRDLAEWCRIDLWFREGAPSPELAEWFAEHPDGWEYFRGRHHEQLTASTASEALRRLSQRGMREDFTLVHADPNPRENAAVSLYEFLAELQAYCTDEPSDSA